MKNSLRELRGEKGWSQARLAVLAGVSRQTIQALESGKYDPSLPLAFTLAALTLEAAFWNTAAVLGITLFQSRKAVFGFLARSFRRKR